MSGIVTENGRFVTDEMIAEWENALDRDEWPSGWMNVREAVEGGLPKDAPEMATLSFKVPASLKRALEKEAKAEGRSTSAYVRRLLAAGLMSIAQRGDGERRRNVKSEDRYFYPAVFTYEPGCEIAVTFPDLGVATSGVDESDALMSARELLGIVIFGMEQDSEELPEPTHVNAVKVGDNERAVLVDVYMPSVRMGNVDKVTTRSVTLPAWLDALAVENGIDCSQVLQEGLRQRLCV